MAATAVTLLVSLSGALAGSAPCRIYWANAPVGPNQTALIAGASFPPEPVVLVSLDSNASAPIAIITPLQVTASSVKAVLPPALKLWAYSVRVCAGANHAECSNALPVNVADVWWLAGDAGNSSTAGGWLRLFGNSLDFAGYQQRDGASGRAARAEERLQHALRSKDHAAITRHAAELAALLGGRGAGAGGSDGSRGGAELRLQLGSAAPITLPAVNASLWDATFAIPSDLKPGTYALAARNQYQSEWTAVSFFQPGNPAFPVVSSVEIGSAPSVEHVKTFAVADFMAAFGIPSHGLNYTTGAPVNGTAAVHAALAAAAKAGPEVEKVVLLPIGKLFIDGGLSIPPRTTVRGTAQDKSTLYFMEDGIGTQLGGLSRADGGSPTPDPAYIFGNHTSSWGVEHLSSECSNGRPQPSRHAVV
eukprot:COSAG04_NODE_339_length_16323_cov_3.879315_8_plen_419_part_00